MGYAQLNKSRFSYDVFLRGEDYEQMGNVRISSFTPTQVNAIVDGTYPYEVRVEFGKDKHILRHSCSCPYHAKGKCCKHIAAVLFAIDNLPESRIINTYPLGEDDHPKYKFQHASGWAIEEFQTKSIEIFQTLLEEKNEVFEKETQYFFQSAFSQYGYKKQRECADTFYKVLLSMDKNGSKKTIFIDSLLRYVESLTIISIFFAKAVYNIKNRAFINKYLSDHPIVIEESLNGDFVAAMNPMNVFTVLDDNVLLLFGSSYYFSFESDQQMFIDACEASEAFDALSALLKRTRFGSDPATKRILSILNKDSSKVDSFLVTLQAYSSESVGFLDMFDAFMKLTEEEKAQVREKVLYATRWSPDNHTAISIALGNHFNVTDVQRLSIPSILLISDIIENKGDEFIGKCIPKRIEKEIKYFNSHYSGEASFNAIIDLIGRFAKYPLVANTMRDQTLEKISMSTPAMRKKYILMADSLGLLKANGIYPFHEVGLCF